MIENKSKTIRGQILELAMEGKNADEIAASVDRSINYIRAVISQLHKREELPPEIIPHSLPQAMRPSTAEVSALKIGVRGITLILDQVIENEMVFNNTDMNLAAILRSISAALTLISEE